MTHSHQHDELRKEAVYWTHNAWMAFTRLLQIFHEWRLNDEVWIILHPSEYELQRITREENADVFFFSNDVISVQYQHQTILQSVSGGGGENGKGTTLLASQGARISTIAIVSHDNQMGQVRGCLWRPHSSFLPRFGQLKVPQVTNKVPMDGRPQRQPVVKKTKNKKNKTRETHLLTVQHLQAAIASPSRQIHSAVEPKYVSITLSMIL